MTDETETTSEVARVLREHYGWAVTGERVRTTDVTVYGCQGCPAEIWRDEEHKGWTADAMRERFAAHQAAMLAEAGLLRDQAFVDLLEERIDAVLRLADHWEAAQKANRESLERRELALMHTPDPQDFRYAATGCLDVPPVGAQIATQEPAGATQGGSGDSGASDTLSARLRALIPATYTDDGYFGVTALEIGEFADEAHRLEVHARVVEQSLRTSREDVERVRAQLVRMTVSSDEKTQRHGTALLHILDGKDAP